MATDPNIEHVKERIKFLTEVLKLLFALLLLLLSGTIALIIKQFKEPSPREALLIGFGMIFSLAVSVVVYSVYSSIDSKINQLRK